MIDASLNIVESVRRKACNNMNSELGSVLTGTMIHNCLDSSLEGDVIANMVESVMEVMPPVEPSEGEYIAAHITNACLDLMSGSI